MRTTLWLIPALLLACNKETDDDGLVTQPTRVRVAPEVFLGDVACSQEGGMHTYQATLLDVTDGLEEAFTLPSSSVVQCSQDVEFQYVEAGHRYIALVNGFDRSDLVEQNPGSPVVVGPDGKAASPRWTTTCWGYDNLLSVGMGGAGPDLDALGGAGGASSLGVESFSKTIVTVRGCEPLSGAASTGATSVAFDITPALLDIDCGTDAGQISEFSVRLSTEEPEVEPAPGGMGGGGGAPAEPEVATAACGEVFVLEDVPPASHLTFVAEGYSADSGDVVWQSTCRALSVAGVTVKASCDPAPGL